VEASTALRSIRHARPPTLRRAPPAFAPSSFRAEDTKSLLDVPWYAASSDVVISSESSGSRTVIVGPPGVDATPVDATSLARSTAITTTPIPGTPTPSATTRRLYPSLDACQDRRGAPTHRILEGGAQTHRLMSIGSWLRLLKERTALDDVQAACSRPALRCLARTEPSGRRIVKSSAVPASDHPPSWTRV
jgi:hypothetical protein